MSHRHSVSETDDEFWSHFHGSYEFDEHQKEVFRYLVSVIRGCAVAFAVLAAASLALAAVEVRVYERTISIYHLLNEMHSCDNRGRGT
jgi:hypothetical protein